MKDPCDCSLPAPYLECCGRWHQGEPAPTPEALMRSRYSAFVRGDVPYLLASWHPSTRPSSIALEQNLRWLGLTIKNHHSTGPDSATVEFVARSRLGGGKAQRLQELSRFVREDGRWFYLDGEHH